MNVPVVISFIKRLKQVQITIERLYRQLPHDDPRLMRLKRMRRYIMDKLYAARVPLDRYIVQPDLIALPAVTAGRKTKRAPLPKKSGAHWPPY